MTPDGFFMAEWRARRPGDRRSLRRAHDLGAALGVMGQPRPVLSVVGSKGKGTTATYASAVLAAAGCRVVTVTSPGYRSATERIRVNGRAISAGRLLQLAHRLQDAVQALPGGAHRYGGYLAPTGLFTLAGLLHAGDVRADVIVLEAGMGGASDEISLFPPKVAAIASIFAEHVGKLGDTPAEIAREKAAIVTPLTKAVLTVRQPAEVRQAITDTVRERLGNPAHVEIVGQDCMTIPRHLRPAGLSAANAELGCAAAGRMLDMIGRSQPPKGQLNAMLASVRLPGRLSRHRLPGARTELIVDAAINAVGVAAALAAARSWWGAIDRVVVCLPDHKDVAGAIGELRGLPVTFVRLPGSHLRFTHPLPAHWSVINAGQLTREHLIRLGDRLLAVGTVYFAGRLLDLAEADTQCLFCPRVSARPMNCTV